MASKAKVRSAVTGKQLGWRAVRSINKNTACVDQFISLLESHTSLPALQAELHKQGITLARVSSMLGAGHLDVILLDFDTFRHAAARVPICGAIRFKGRAANLSKQELPHCMTSGDIIVVRGYQAAGKLPVGTLPEVDTILRTLGFKLPAGFFDTTRKEKEDLLASSFCDDDDGIEWDRSDELRAAKAEMQALRDSVKAKEKVKEKEKEKVTESDDEDVDIDAI